MIFSTVLHIVTYCTLYNAKSIRCFFPSNMIQFWNTKPAINQLVALLTPICSATLQRADVYFAVASLYRQISPNLLWNCTESRCLLYWQISLSVVVVLPSQWAETAFIANEDLTSFLANINFSEQCNWHPKLGCLTPRMITLILILHLRDYKVQG